MPEVSNSVEGEHQESSKKSKGRKAQDSIKDPSESVSKEKMTQHALGNSHNIDVVSMFLYPAKLNIDLKKAVKRCDLYVWCLHME